MLCPACKSELRSGAVGCPVCGADIVLFRKTAALSNRLYNEGLSRARSGDISGAIESLTKSVSINKRNIDARNLLGLCQYRVGSIGEALRQWIISHSYKKDGNLADYYIKVFEKNQRHMDELSEAVSMYNSALQYLRQRNEDMAVIQLRKALEKNPQFVDAINLLALCYIVAKNRAGAMSMINKALAVDACNPVAMNYFRELNPGRNAPDTRGRAPQEINVRVPGKAVPSYNPYMGKARGGGSALWAVAGLITGAFITFLVMFMLVMPAYIGSKDAEIAEIQSSSSDSVAALTAESQTKSEQLAAIQAQLDDALDNVDALQEQVSALQRDAVVGSALLSLSRDEPETAVLILEGVDASDLTGDVLETYNHIRDTAYPLLEEQYYASGTSAYNSNNYEDAKAYLETAVKYATTDSGTIDDAFYFLGRIAEAGGETELARSYYENIVNNYADSNRLSQARNRLNTL